MSGQSGSIHGLTGKALMYERYHHHSIQNPDSSANTNTNFAVILRVFLFLLACFYLAMIKALCQALSRTTVSILPSEYSL